MTLSRDAIIIISVAVVNLAHGRRDVLSVAARKADHGQPARDGGGRAPAERARAGLPRPCAWFFLITLVLTVTSALHYVYLASTGRTGVAPS